MPYADPERQREYQRQWVAQRRAEFFADKVCIECGSTEYLELDHVDPAHKLSHSIWSWSQERREAELAKCQVLCEPHHMDKTLSQRENWEHGTASGYASGCRETCCRTAASEAKATWRTKRNVA